MTDEERHVVAPQFVQGREVWAMVRLAPRSGEVPNQWGVICREPAARSSTGEESYIVWSVTYDNGEYRAERGVYDLTWEKARATFNERYAKGKA